ncbi:MAG: helix-turn-helix domain-containing protein [Spirosomataceae bacterium]
MRRWVVIIMLLSNCIGWAQVRLEITHYPTFKSTDTRIFIASSFNDWNPGDPTMELKRRADGVYYLDLPDTLTHFEYKFTQGSWILVEGKADGTSRPNRIYDRLSSENPNLIAVQIAGWEAKPTYRFVIKQIPANTPKDATLYIVGNFNNWRANDEDYKLQRQFDGTYRVSVISDLNRIEYKFTRGDWNMVEGMATGRARPNRVLIPSRLKRTDAIEIEKIESWEDLSGTFNFFSIYDLLLLFSAFQSILLVIFIPTIQDYNRQANRWLVISLAVSSLLVFLKVISAYREVAQQNTKLLFLPDFVLFLYAPLFYFYIQKLLFKSALLPRRWWLHFVPVLVQFFVYLPYFLMDSKTLQYKIVNLEIDLAWVYTITASVGLLFNGYYWIICQKTLRQYQQQYSTVASSDQSLQYLTTVLVIQAVCLVLWLFTGALIVIQQVFESDIALIIQGSVDLIWLAFSTIPYLLGYFAIHQPEIFKLPSQSISFLPQENTTIDVEHPVVLDEEAVEPNENLEVYREKIDTYIAKHKPYINAGLTLNEMASKLKMSPHLLSKVINEVYGKNFFDFVNAYRIEEFIERFEDSRNKNFTMLAIAFDVGFNSKTAFNRAFKKMTQQSPREYFYESRVGD